jgi:hypothetical protein
LNDAAQAVADQIGEDLERLCAERGHFFSGPLAPSFVALIESFALAIVREREHN